MNLRAMIDESYWSLLAATHLPGEDAPAQALSTL